VTTKYTTYPIARQIPITLLIMPVFNAISSERLKIIFSDNPNSFAKITALSTVRCAPIAKRPTPNPINPKDFR